ncbi:MAG: hypothetical protein ISP45_01855 [Reyranella sp.]|nr:hypothetical protein [Reyranella sp.]
MQVTPEMDRRHAPDSDAATWNESWYFNFYDPQVDVGGYLRIGLLPNARVGNMWAALFVAGEEVYNRFHLDRPLPEGDIETGLALDGLTLRAEKLLERYRLRFEDPYTGVHLDLLWSAVHPAYNNSLRHLHLEQGARFEGTLKLRGRSWQLAGTAFRDHATGKRDWEAMGSHELMWPVFQDGTAAGLVRVRHRKGAVDTTWAWDGKAFRQPGVEELNLRTDGRGMPTGVTATLVETSGARRRIEGTVVSVCNAFFDGYRLHECMARFTDDAGRVGYGLLEVGRRPGEPLHKA